MVLVCYYFFHVFYYSFRITDIRFCKDIEAIFVIRITFGFNFFKRRTNYGFHFIEECGAESITQIGIAENFNLPPDAIITIPAFGNEAVDMRIPL